MMMMMTIFQILHDALSTTVLFRYNELHQRHTDPDSKFTVEVQQSSPVRANPQ